ncbi:MAG: ABC transporter permease [Firmicutes bacterium]|nr:ABC transporter permease [Bacillota bacterium]
MAVEKQTTIEDIKHHLEANLGKKVFIRASKGRRRYLESEGILVETYPKLFVVDLDQSNAVRRRSYTYADVLTETVQITIDDERVGSH